MKKYLIIVLLLLAVPCWGADSKISELTENSSPTTDDLLVTVDDPSGTPVTKKATLANLFKWALVPGGSTNVTTITGNYAFGITLTDTTNVTFPTSGTLATTEGTLASTALDDTKGNGDTAYIWSADKVYDQLALKLNATSLDDTKGNGDTTYIWSADKVYDQLALKAASDHNHSGTYQPADADLTTWAGITPGTNVGTAIAQTLNGGGGLISFAASPGTCDSTTFIRGDRTCVAPGGSGDVTSVWNDDTGDVSALVAAAGDSFNAGSADTSAPFKAGNTAGLPGTCTANETYHDTQAKILYLCTAANTWTQVIAVGADGSYRIVMQNNTAISPTASAYEVYFDAGVFKWNENGTERTPVKTSDLGSNVGTFLATPSLANLGSALTDEGTGVITAMGNATNGSGGFITYGNAAGTAAPLTGYSKGAGTVAATDTILQAIQKLDGNDDAKAPLANPQFTGVVDIAANATTDAEGEITIDTTTNQLRYYGGAQRVLSPIQSASFVITAPAATDDINIMKAPYGMTISGIDCIVQGSTSVTGQLQECSSTGGSCADLDSDITCDADGAADDGSLTDSTITSGNWLRWKTTSVSGTPTFLTVTFKYLVVAD